MKDFRFGAWGFRTLTVGAGGGPGSWFVDWGLGFRVLKFRAHGLENRIRQSVSRLSELGCKNDGLGAICVLSREEGLVGRFGV